VEFSHAIKAAINKVLMMLAFYATRYKNVRIAHPKTFPYNIHFYINEHNKRVVFTSIVHNKKRPKFKII
jgi:hypothetical protein